MVAQSIEAYDHSCDEGNGSDHGIGQDDENRDVNMMFVE